MDNLCFKKEISSLLDYLEELKNQRYEKVEQGNLSKEHHAAILGERMLIMDITMKVCLIQLKLR